ncbi:MAG: ChbG/HpnK family deacetylase [Magnetococcales bacterium]|nr:ChbG/HpnK family deacetylase [Magnetococcales bacterium]
MRATHAGRKRLIVNADDLGLSVAVNRGILKAHRQGIVTSATLLANGPAFDDAVQRIREAPELGIGVHLNVLRGAPLTDPERLPHLTRNGRFHLSWSRMGMVWRPGMAAEIAWEYRAQIERVLAAGIAITHLDGEKHHQQFPPLFRLLRRLLPEYGIRAVRCAPESLTFRFGLTKMVKVAILNTLVRINRASLEATGIRSPDHQAGIAMTGKMTVLALETILSNLPAGVTELCCHPGCMDAEHLLQTADFGSFYIDDLREGELALLTAPDLRRTLALAGIDLIHYADL